MHHIGYSKRIKCWMYKNTVSIKNDIINTLCEYIVLACLYVFVEIITFLHKRPFDFEHSRKKFTLQDRV